MDERIDRENFKLIWERYDKNWDTVLARLKISSPCLK